MRAATILETLPRITPPSQEGPRADNDWARLRITYTVGLLQRFLKPGDRVMDVASGPHFSYIVNRAVPGLTWLPTDVDGIPIEMAEDGRPVFTYTPTQFLLHDSRQPLPHRNLDAVTFFEVIEHLPWNPGQLLGEMNESLKDGGLLILSTPNIGSRIAILRELGGGRPHQTPFFAKVETTFNFHKREYSVWEIRELARWAGFELISHTTRNATREECMTWRAAVHHACLLLAAALSLSPLEVRHLLKFSGSTQFLVARKVRAPRWDVKPPEV